MSHNDPYFSSDLNNVARAIAHWRAGKGFNTHWKNAPEKLMLVVTELGEAMEAYRHLSERTLSHMQGNVELGTPANIDPDQAPILENFIEELADTFIRLLDMTGSFEIDISTAIARKMAKNEKRPYKHGKEC